MEEHINDIENPENYFLFLFIWQKSKDFENLCLIL